MCEPEVAHILRLQRTIGNRATTQLLQRKPESLAKAGVKTDDRVGDKTAAAIQAALEESEELKPYLKDKFPKAAITSDFDIHSDDDDFNEAAKKMKTQRAAAYGKIGGFYDRSTHHIHLRARSKFGHEYKDRLACANKLVALTDWQAVAKAFFVNDGALLEAVKKKLNMDVGPLRKALLDDTVCARL